MSSTVIDARQISRHHGARTVLESVDFRVGSESRIGLVGPNGSGKSTLLRVLAGFECPDAGSVRRFGTVGYLPQVVPAAEMATAREVILERVGVTSAARAVDFLAARLEARDLEALDEHAEAIERWLALGGADADARLASAASEVGLAADLLDRPLGDLSGGQAARVGLAALRMARFDAVLLDEPTNDLDSDGLVRLAALIDAHRGGIVVVSHDRDFLATTVVEIVELGLHEPGATSYAGGWEAYEREREAAAARARDAYERQQTLERRGRNAVGILAPLGRHRGPARRASAPSSSAWLASASSGRRLASMCSSYCGGFGRAARTLMPRSRSCTSSTGAGAPVSGSPPEAVFGNAITSRIESAPTRRWMIRSRP